MILTYPHCQKILTLRQSDAESPFMEKDNFFTQARIEPKLFYSKKVRKLQQKEFATKQRKMYLIITMSKIELPHNYRGYNYVMNLNLFCLSLSKKQEIAT